mmetsp:Transcript_29613/g.95674  ORF Transcript_29613/g.95674 Transcript_29613/m.95674 type:complete len:296 (+) Transcript_29613:1156-2043(+)
MSSSAAAWPDWAAEVSGEIIPRSSVAGPAPASSSFASSCMYPPAAAAEAHVWSCAGVPASIFSTSSSPMAAASTSGASPQAIEVMITPRTTSLSSSTPPGIACTPLRIRIRSSSSCASACAMSTRLVNALGMPLSGLKRGHPSAEMTLSHCSPMRSTTAQLGAATAVWISSRHHDRKKAILARTSFGSRSTRLANVCSMVMPANVRPCRSFSCVSERSHAMTNEEQRAMTPAKARSAVLPGHCRTANTSSQTSRERLAWSASAETSTPHCAPQQWLPNVTARPTAPVSRTSGRSV